MPACVPSCLLARRHASAHACVHSCMKARRMAGRLAGLAYHRPSSKVSPITVLTFVSSSISRSWWAQSSAATREGLIDLSFSDCLNVEYGLFDNDQYRSFVNLLTAGSQTHSR